LIKTKLVAGLTMRLRIVTLVLAVAAVAWAGGIGCTYNGTTLPYCVLGATGSGTAQVGTFPNPIGTAYQLVLHNIGNDTAYVTTWLPGGEIGPVTGLPEGTLAQTTATFDAYVPGAATNGSDASLDPYMILGVYPTGADPSNYSDPYALVIVNNSGFNQFQNDGWYMDGIGPNSTVHIMLWGTWATNPALSGITNPDWLSCCSDLPTLSQLDGTALPGGGTWGDLNLDEAWVQVGNWGGSGGPYTAYVSGMDITVTPEPITPGIVGLGLLGLCLAAKRRHHDN
jgi:hypothetical protein